MPTPQHGTVGEFNEASDHFADYGQTVRGHIRYELVHDRLAAALSGSPRRAIDVHGGSGIDTAWLADFGHTVTYLEAAPAQVNKALQRFDNLDNESRQRIRVKDGNALNP